MKNPTTRLPDDRAWIYEEISGKKTGWAALPATEVLAIVSLVQYLTEQLAACHAIRTPAPATSSP